MVEAESNSSFAQTAIIEHPLLLNKFLVSGGNAGGSKTHPNLHYNFNINSNGLLAVARELRIESSDPERKVAVNGGEIETWGDVVFGTGANGGSVAIVLSGANVQNISQVEGVAPTGEWRVDKNGGRVVLATDLTLVGGSQDMVWESGVIDLSTNRLVVGRDLLSGSGEQRLAVMMADELVAGCLMIGRNAESLEGVVLEMDGPDKGREPLLGQSYTVVSTGNPLESELESVMWHNPWRGKVDYSENEGRDVVVYGIWLVHTGTVVVVR